MVISLSEKGDIYKSIKKVIDNIALNICIVCKYI